MGAHTSPNASFYEFLGSDADAVSKSLAAILARADFVSGNINTGAGFGRQAGWGSAWSQNSQMSAREVVEEASSWRKRRSVVVAGLTALAHLFDPRSKVRRNKTKPWLRDCSE